MSRGRVRQRWQAWWEARLSRQDAMTLTQRNVYILPTRAGWMLALTLLTLLIGAINFQLNLGYVLTFLLAGSALAGMQVGHANLRGLHLQLQALEACFAGCPTEVRLTLSNPDSRDRHAIGLRWRGHSAWTWCDVPAQQKVQLKLAAHMPLRGRHALPTIALETRFPMGTFRVWTYWRAASEVMVYPQAEVPAPALPVPWQPEKEGAEFMALAQPDMQEPTALRAYRPGDPPKYIDWKKSSKHTDWISRDADAGQPGLLWLDWDHAGPGTEEQKLSRLCAWVLQAEQQALCYGLRLPGRVLAPAQGAQHQRQCLEALALWS